MWGSNSLVARWRRISRGDFLRIWPAQARLGSNYQRYAQQVWWQKARAGSPVAEQLALHGPTKDDQTVVAATHIPFTWHQWWTQTMQIWAPRTKPINLVLGQRQPSGKSRDVDANAEDADRCKLLWLTTTTTIDARRVDNSHRLGEHTKTSHLELHLYLPPKIPHQNNPYHSTHFLFNLCCIISKFWRTHNLLYQATRCFVFVRINTRHAALCAILKKKSFTLLLSFSALFSF